MWASHLRRGLVLYAAVELLVERQWTIFVAIQRAPNDTVTDSP
jgi:hypothetical protein